MIEQRVTGIIIFGLIGCSIFITKYLSYIPMPVLYAIFMYMGVTPMEELEYVKLLGNPNLEIVKSECVLTQDSTSGYFWY